MGALGIINILVLIVQSQIGIFTCFDTDVLPSTARYLRHEHHRTAYNISQNVSAKSSIRHVNDFFLNSSNIANFGKLLDCRNDTETMKAFHTFRTGKRKRFGTDNEDFDSMERYFWGMRDGLVMEIGALNGVKHSNSYPLFNMFGWRRLLVEANPGYASQLAKDSPDSFAFGAAICASEQSVHYITGSTTGGIIEFMSEHFIRDWHKGLLHKDKSEWSLLPAVSVIQCLPLSDILAEAQVKHVNLFVLDVEGAELSILRTIRFEVVRIDVLVVEVEAKNRPVGYQDDVTAFLGSQGYNLSWTKGRNAWYTHPLFKPFSYFDKTNT